MSFERYSRAVHSKNLAMSDWRTLDVDWIAAAGASQIHGSPLPGIMARWLAQQHPGEVFRLLAALQKAYGKTRMLTNDARDDILAAADWWYDRTCQDCGGRGHRQIPNTPNMEDAPCPTCDGTGTRDHAATTHAYSWALKELDMAATACASAITAKVA